MCIVMLLVFAILFFLLALEARNDITLLMIMIIIELFILGHIALNIWVIYENL